ncbi:MAG: hypothetical protein U0521_03895 [Anaerolineae bacterium]
MEQLLAILSVAALFLLRIGVPVLILISLGILIDRWQARREDAVRRELNKHA